MDTSNLAEAVKDYILQLEAQIADLKDRYDEAAGDAIQLHTQVTELQAENADLRDEMEAMNSMFNQPSYD